MFLKTNKVKISIWNKVLIFAWINGFVELILNKASFNLVDEKIVNSVGVMGNFEEKKTSKMVRLLIGMSNRNDYTPRLVKFILFYWKWKVN